MKGSTIKAAKKKREHFMIELRKDKNDELFRDKRQRVDHRIDHNSKSDEYLAHEVQAFQNKERALSLAIKSGDVEEVLSNLDMIRKILTMHSDSDMVPWKAFFNTNLFDVITVDLRNKDYFNDVDIQREVLW